MSRLAALMGICGLAFAADAWMSKPVSEWTENDARRVLTNSPWAHKVPVSRGDPQSAPSGPSAGPARDPNEDGVGRMTAQGAIPDTGRGQRTTPGEVPVDLIVVWQSALPVRQAASKMKTSPFDRELSGYVIAVTGVPRANRADATLTVKRREPVRSIETQESAHWLYFVFPKDPPFSLEEKEVEFAARIGALNVGTKFRLKDMVYEGRLRL